MVLAVWSNGMGCTKSLNKLQSRDLFQQNETFTSAYYGFDRLDWNGSQSG